MSHKYDVVALGELLIDFTQNGRSSQGNSLFECNPGGAPCNVLAMLQKLGKKTAFIGKVGNDIFGHLLKEKVGQEGINLEGLVMSDSIRTTLAFVENQEDGERNFSFYRNPGADMSLEAAEVNDSVIENAKIFHFGSLSMTDPKVEEATIKAIEIAKKNGCLISFDPNLREALWSSLDLAKEKISYGLSQCDILKISDNEIYFMTGEDDIEKGMQKLLAEYRPIIAFATLGKNGSMAYYKDYCVSEKAVLNQHTIDCTGAGDTFMGAALAYLLEHDLNTVREKELHELLHFANGAASLITMRKGALCVMPSRTEILDFIR